jgi:hypothetical protein
MPNYQIDTGKGVLEIEHGGPISDLHGAVQSWLDERDPQKQFDAGLAVQQATLPQDGTGLKPGEVDSGPSFLPKKYAYDGLGAVAVPPTQQEVADAMQYQQGDTPIVLIPPLQGDQFSGLNAVTGALSSFTTPKNIGMLAGAGVGGAIGIPAKLIAGAFAVDMGKHLVSESVPEVRDAVIATGWTSPETGKALAEAGLTGLMTAGAAGHALDGRPLGGRESASMAESLREKLVPSLPSEAAALKQKVFESDAGTMAKDFISKIKPTEISKGEVDGALSEMLGKPQTEGKVTTNDTSQKEGQGRREEVLNATAPVTDQPLAAAEQPVPPPAEPSQKPSGKPGLVAGADTTPTAEPLKVTTPASDTAPEANKRVQLKTGPQTYEVVEELAPKKGDLPEEKYFRVRNERTGKEQTAEAADMRKVAPKTPTQNTRMGLADKVRRVADEMGTKKATGTGFGITGLDSAMGFKSPIDGWKDKISAMLNLAESARRFVRNRGQRDEIAATFDAADNQAGYIARQARRHVELARGGEKPSAHVSELEQKAATFVRQANGDKAGMLSKFAAIRGKGYDSVLDYAEEHWDELFPIAEAARASTDSAFLEAEAAGVSLEYRDNYVKGAYDFPFDDKVIFDETGGGRGAGTSFKKSKVFKDYAEAIASGFKPKELRLDLLTESAVNSALKVVNRAKWATSLGDIQMPNGEPAVVSPKANGSAPRGYRNIQVSPGKLIAVHEELAPTIEALTGSSMVPKVISTGGAFIKHNMLVFDIFHASRFAQMQAAFEGRIPSYHKGLSLLEFADADLTKAMDRKLISPEEAAWARSNRPKLEGMMKQGLNAGRISDALFADAAPLLPGAKQANKFIFEKLSRGIITQSAITAFERNAKLHPEWSEKELNRYTAKEVNTYYRNLGNQGVIKSKTFQDLARILLLAPQWQEGMIRSESRGIGQTAKGLTSGKFGNISKGMGTGLVAYFALAQVVNMLTRGKPTWDNDEPGHQMDAWIPDSVEGSGGYFLSPLSVFAETTHDALKYTERGMEPLDVAAQIGSNKQHPQVRAMRDLFEGKDFFGKPLHGWERVTTAAKEVLPIPIFARTGGYKGGMERQMLSTAGIKVTAAPSHTNNVYALADKFKRENGVVQKEAGESEYAKLRRALQNDDMELAQTEYGELLKTKKASLIDSYFAKYPRKPLTGSNAMEAKFRKSLDRGQMDIYNASLQERDAISKLFLQLKKKAN